MEKEKYKYLLHPSNDMLINSKILKDINGRGYNRRGSSKLLGLVILTFILLISLNSISEKFTLSNFSLNGNISNSSIIEKTRLYCLFQWTHLYFEKKWAPYYR